MSWRRFWSLVIGSAPPQENHTPNDVSSLIRQLQELSNDVLLPPPLFVDLRRKHLSNPQALIASKGLSNSRSSLAESLRWAESAQRVYNSQNDLSAVDYTTFKRAEAVNNAFEVYASAVLNDEDIVNVCTCFSRRSVHDVNRTVLFLGPPFTSLSGPSPEKDVKSRILLLLVVMGVQFMSFQVCRGALPLWTRCHERCREAVSLPKLIKDRRWKFLFFRAACFLEIARKKHYVEEEEKRIVSFLIEEELGTKPREPFQDDIGYRERALRLALRDFSEAAKDGLAVPECDGGVASLQSLCVDQLCLQSRDVLELLREADPKLAGPVLLHRPQLELPVLLERRTVYFFRGLTRRSLGQILEAKADLELFVELEQVAHQKDTTSCSRFLLTALCHLARLYLLQEPPDFAAAKQAMDFFMEKKDHTRSFWDMDGSGSATWEPSAGLEKPLLLWYKRVKSAGLPGDVQSSQSLGQTRFSRWLYSGPVVDRVRTVVTGLYNRSVRNGRNRQVQVCINRTETRQARIEPPRVLQTCDVERGLCFVLED